MTRDILGDTDVESELTGVELTRHRSAELFVVAAQSESEVAGISEEPFIGLMSEFGVCSS